MNQALPFIIANGVTSAIVAAVFAYLARRNEGAHLRLWALGWIGVSVGEVVGGIDTLYGPTLYGVAAASIVGGLVGILFYNATVAYLNRRRSNVAWVLSGMCVAASIALYFPLRSPAAFFPVLLLTSGLFVTSGVLYLRKRLRSPGSVLAGTALIVNGLHMADFPILAQVEGVLAWGFLISIVLEVALSLGLLMLHYEDAEIRLERATSVLAEARRLEALGRLAGGVAHDFNNLLTVIMSNLDLAADSSDDPEFLGETMSNIRSATERASRLTQQLLAFGRRAPLHREPLDVVSIVEETVEMLRRLLPETVELEFSAAQDSLPTVADRAQLEHLVMNLVTNARDAMPTGGRLGVTLSVDDDELHLEVTDTGPGIPDGVRPRVFEPFFTTKELGRGSGLGLAAVYGIVKQQHGQVDIDSASETGTRVMVTLPFEPLDTLIVAPRAIQAERAGNILVVEDDDDIRELISDMLRRAGYSVMEAVDGQEALELLGETFDCSLVVSDVVMPRVDGLELVKTLARRAPDVGVLLVSGYSCPRDQIEEIPSRVRFLAKPFTRAQLLREVRGLVGETATSGAPKGVKSLAQE